jgi:IMP dehydrogenase/GMP reductase
MDLSVLSNDIIDDIKRRVKRDVLERKLLMKMKECIAFDLKEKFKDECSYCGCEELDEVEKKWDKYYNLFVHPVD